MIMNEPKRTSSIILSKMGPKGSIEPSAATEDESQEVSRPELRAIAEDMMAAHKSGSVEDMMDALDAHRAYCQMDDSEPSDKE